MQTRVLFFPFLEISANRTQGCLKGGRERRAGFSTPGKGQDLNPREPRPVHERPAQEPRLSKDAPLSQEIKRVMLRI